MKLNKEALLNIVKKFEGTAITVIGDIMLDHYIWGTVGRISPEAPVVVVNVTKEDWRLGGAGNVARNLLGLGAKVSISGVLGDDASGKKTLELFASENANIEGIFVNSSRQSIVKSRVIAHSQQVVRIDREEIKFIDEDEIKNLTKTTKDFLASTKGVIISDYGKGTICSELLNNLASSFRNLIEKSVPIIVDPKSPNYPLYKNVSVIKPNKSEASEASGIVIKDRASAAHAGRILLDKWQCKMVLITLGEMGMVIVNSLDPSKPFIEIDTAAKNIYDVSGAGDTVSAVFTLSLAVGASAEEAAQIANFAAGVVISEVGTVAIEKNKLITSIKESDNIN